MKTASLILAAVFFVLSSDSPTVADDVLVRAPFVSVRIQKTGGSRGRVQVTAPYTRVDAAAPNVELAPTPQTRTDAKNVAVAQVLTPKEFARSFKPKAAGNYEVVLLHPHTCCPVKVCFTLPYGCPKKIKADSDDIKFDYGRYEVEIHFKRDGRVKVEYDD